MSRHDVGKLGTLYQEGMMPARCKVLDHQEGRDSGDFLIEYADGKDGRTGVVTRSWFVVRPHGTHEDGTFELNPV